MNVTDIRMGGRYLVQIGQRAVPARVIGYWSARKCWRLLNVETSRRCTVYRPEQFLADLDAVEDRAEQWAAARASVVRRRKNPRAAITRPEGKPL